MRILIYATIIATISVTANAEDTYVDGYTRSNGTYVEPHYRSTANDQSYDNYTSDGNVNPYTGSTGRIEENSSDLPRFMPGGNENTFTYERYERSDNYEGSHKSSYKKPGGGV